MHQTRLENQLSRKLEDKWLGPYYIHDILGNGSYKICKGNGTVLIKFIHGNHLKLYKIPPVLQINAEVRNQRHDLH